MRKFGSLIAQSTVFLCNITVLKTSEMCTKNVTVNLERHSLCYFLIFFSAAHVVSNCSAINTSLTYLMKNDTICGVKKSWARRCAALNGFFMASSAKYVDIIAESVSTGAHVLDCPAPGTQPEVCADGGGLQCLHKAWQTESRAVN